MHGIGCDVSCYIVLQTRGIDFCRNRTGVQKVVSKYVIDIEFNLWGQTERSQ